MSKYFETKKDSLEQAVLEAMSPAQQAAIAISKKEKGEKPKDEKDLDEKAKIEFNDDDKNTISITKKGKLQGKMTKRSDGTWGVVRGGKHYPIKGGKNLDVAKAAVRDLFGEETEEGNAFGNAVMSAKKAGKKEFVFAGKKYNTEDQLDPVNKDAVKKKFKDRKDKDIDNDGDVDSTDKYLHKRRKAISKAVKEQNQTLVQKAANEITKMWEKSAKVKNEEEMDDEDEEEPKNGKKTMTGKPMSKVETSPKDKIEK